MTNRTRGFSVAFLMAAVAGASAKAPVPPVPEGGPLPPGAVARLGEMRLSHAGPVECLAFSPDGKQLVSAGHDGQLRFWEVGTGRQLRTLDLGDTLVRDVRQVAFSPDGRTLALAGKAAVVQLRDAVTFKEIETFKGSKRADGQSVFAFAPDGRWFAWWTSDGTIRVRDLKNEETPYRLQSVFDPPVLVFDPDGKQLAFTDADDTSVLDLTTGKELRESFVRRPIRGALGFSPDGKLLAIGDLQGVVVRDSTVRRRFINLLHKTPVQGLTFTADGKTLYAVAINGECKQWTVKTEQEERSFRLAPAIERRDVVLHTAFSPDAKILAWSTDYRIRLTDLATGKELMPQDEVFQAGGPFAFTPDGKQVLATTVDGRPRLWDADGNWAVKRFEGVVRGVSFVAFAADGQRAVTVGHDVVVWDVEKGRELKRFVPVIPGYGVTAALSADGKTLALGEVDFPDAPVPRGCKVHLWDVATGKELAVSEAAHTGSAQSLAFDPAGKVLASAGSDRVVNLWDVATGKRLVQVEGGREFNARLAFAADGKTLLLAQEISDKRGRVSVRLTLSEPDASKDRRQYDAEPGVVFRAFAPDGKLVALQTTANTIRVVDTATAKTVAEFTSQPELVRPAAFTADSKKLATGCADGTILVWDLTRAPK